MRLSPAVWDRDRALAFASRSIAIGEGYATSGNIPARQLVGLPLLWMARGVVYDGFGGAAGDHAEACGSYRKGLGLWSEFAGAYRQEYYVEIEEMKQKLARCE